MIVINLLLRTVRLFVYKIILSVCSVFVKIFCKHDYVVVRKIYGDEINFHNGKRTELKCRKCGRYSYE